MAKLLNNLPPNQPNKEEVGKELEKDNGVDKYIKEYTKDLNLLQNQLALFHPSGKKFYKLGMIDMRGQRFEVFGESMTRFFKFQDVILFNYFIEEDFDKYYEIYKTGEGRIWSKEKVMQWLTRYEGRIDHMDGYKERLERLAAEKETRLRPK